MDMPEWVVSVTVHDSRLNVVEQRFSRMATIDGALGLAANLVEELRLGHMEPGFYGQDTEVYCIDVEVFNDGGEEGTAKTAPALPSPGGGIAAEVVRHQPARDVPALVRDADSHLGRSGQGDMGGSQPYCQDQERPAVGHASLSYSHATARKGHLFAHDPYDRDGAGHR